MRRATTATLAFMLALLPACALLAQQAPDYVDLEQEPIRRSITAADAVPAPTPNAIKAATQPAKVAAARAKPTSGFDPGRVAGSLVVVVLLIVLFWWVAKRFFGAAGAARSTRMVQVLCRSPLSPKQQLVLLRVGRRLLVVSDGGGQMNTLSEITDPDEVAALMGQVQDEHAERATKSFTSVFGGLRRKYDEPEEENRETEVPEPDDGDGVQREPADVTRESATAAATDEDPAVESTRRELNGLMDKVRLLARQFKSP